jgi:hypothetical protein
MIPLRRGIFALVVACVAFAAGVALGNGPLQGRSDRASMSADNVRLARELSDLRAAGTYDDAFVSAISSRLIMGRLANRVVTLVVLPRTPTTTVAAMSTDLTAAGARIAVTLDVRPRLVDSAKKVYVASVADNARRGATDLRSTTRGDAYDAMGALIARAYVARSAHGSAFDQESVGIDAQLTGADLVRTTGTPARRGNLVVVLDPGRHGSSAALRASRVIEESLLTALATGSDRLVVATSSGGDRPGGLLTAVRSRAALRAVATVNVAATQAGRTTTVLALASGGAGRRGADFGVVGGRAVLPAGLR